MLGANTAQFTESCSFIYYYNITELMISQIIVSYIPRLLNLHKYTRTRFVDQLFYVDNINLVYMENRDLN